MKKQASRLLSAAMCLVMVLGLLGGCAATEPVHDHTGEEEENIVIPEEQVPLAEEPGREDTTPTEEPDGKDEPDEPGGEAAPEDTGTGDTGAGETTVGEHEHQWEMHGVKVSDDCIYGETWKGYELCTVCGARRDIAYRPESLKQKGSHDYVETVRRETECPDHPYIEQKCSKCGNLNIIEGGHNWSDWVLEGNPNKCTDSYTESRTCSYCGETETRSHQANGHSWRILSETEATCTEGKKVVRKCNVCGEEEEVVGLPLGHNYQTVNGDCLADRVCARCGATAKSTGHRYGNTYKSDSSGHWKVCQECGNSSAVEKHYDNGNGICVCGYKMPASSARCNHTWEIVKRTSTFTHREKCSLCGAERSVNCSESSLTVGRTYCTDTLYCQCGNVSKSGQRNHNFGTWRCTDSTHSHQCQNIGCQYVTSGTHTFTTTSGKKTCSVCKYVDPTYKAPHTHTFGGWTAGANGCVQYCTDPNCSAVQTTAHVAGPADCLGNAVCKNCGAAMTVAASSNHVGPTEIRNAVPAAVEKAGYTGDTYCVACNKIIRKGQTIEALKADHVHAFTILQHDSTGHWNACECGEKQAVAAHTGGTATCTAQAVCSVCGEKYGSLDAGSHVGGTHIVNAVPAEAGRPGYTGDTHCVGCGALIAKGEAIPALEPEHEHDYTAVKSDSVEHWNECACGDRQNLEAHTFADGVCTVCGALEPAKVEDAHVHSFSSDFSSSAEYHWHTCSTCGSQSELEPHMFVDDACITCGMTVKQMSHEQTVEQAQIDFIGEKSVRKVFKDMSTVTAADYYALPVQRLYSAGIMKGTSEDSFGGTQQINRDQVMIIVARISGQKDADPADWEATRAAYMTWANANQITVEGPETAPATRAETVYMLWVAANKPQSAQDLSAYADAGTIDAEYQMAVRWAVENGILTGDGNGHINPGNEITRQDAATLVTRYIDNMGVSI